MDIKEAREIIKKWPIGFSNYQTGCAEGFIEAYEQQSALIKRLAKALERIGDREDITPEEDDGWGCLCDMGDNGYTCGQKIAEFALSTIPKEYLSEGNESENRDSEEKE